MLATETTIIATHTIIASNTGNISSETARIASIPALPIGEEIYDLMDTVSMSYPWENLFLEIAIIIVCIYFLYLFYSWITSPVEKKRNPIVQSPETQALRAIKRLKLSDVWEKRNIKSICENVASILKNYALDAYHIGLGAASTTDEFIPAVIDGKVKNEILCQIREMLDYCDEIRYTGNNNEKLKPEELVNTLEKLINTKGWQR